MSNSENSYRTRRLPKSAKPPVPTEGLALTTSTEAFNKDAEPWTGTTFSTRPDDSTGQGHLPEQPFGNPPEWLGRSLTRLVESDPKHGAENCGHGAYDRCGGGNGRPTLGTFAPLPLHALAGRGEYIGLPHHCVVLDTTGDPLHPICDER